MTSRNIPLQEQQLTRVICQSEGWPAWREKVEKARNFRAVGEALLALEENIPVGANLMLQSWRTLVRLSSSSACNVFNFAFVHVQNIPIM